MVRRWLLVLCLVGLVACTSGTETEGLPIDLQPVQTFDVEQDIPTTVLEYAQTEFSPSDAKYFDLIDATLQFNKAELALSRNLSPGLLVLCC